MDSGFFQGLWSGVPSCSTGASAFLAAVEVVSHLGTLTWSFALISISLATWQSS